MNMQNKKRLGGNPAFSHSNYLIICRSRNRGRWGEDLEEQLW